MTYSIIQKSQLEGAQRIDAEYFQPQYLDLENNLKIVKTISLGDISERIINFGAYSLCNFIEWQENGVPYLNVGDIKDGFIDYSNVKYISEKVHEILSKSAVREGDIVMPIAGSIGNVAVADNIPEKLNSNQAIVKITLKKKFSPYFVAAFLRSKFGHTQIIREIVSSVQANIFLFQIKEFKIPILSYVKQLEIEKIYKDGLKKLYDSKKYYQQAEDLLLGSLGLKDFDETSKLFSIVNFSDCQKFNRVDAEYFLPKYEKLISEIKKKNGKPLGNLVSLTKGFEPGGDAYQEAGKPFIRVSSLSKDGLADGDQKYLDEELYEKLKNSFEPRVGEVLLTKDATPGIAFAVEKPIEGIISGGILRLKTKTNIDIQYLALVLNSVVGRMQAERDSGGSIIAHWRPEQIKNILIPVLPPETQQKTAELVRKSHTARQKSKELLEEAKRKVEEMIEKGE